MGGTILGSKNGLKFHTNADDITRRVQYNLDILTKQKEMMASDDTGHAIAFDYTGEGELARTAWDRVAVYAMVTPVDGGPAELKIIDHYWSAAEVEADPNWIASQESHHLRYVGRIANRYSDIFGLANKGMQELVTEQKMEKRVHNVRGECYITPDEAELLRFDWLIHPVDLEQSKQRRLKLVTRFETELKKMLPAAKVMDRINGSSPPEPLGP